MQDKEWRKIEKFIKGLRVKVSHRDASSRGYKIAKISEKSAAEVTFSHETESGSKTITVAAYFKNVYRTSLRYPKLRCITVGRDVVLPMEVCSVVEGQRYPKKLDEAQTAEMIRFAALKPTDRENSIKNGLRVLDYGHNEFHKSFGLKVSNEMSVVNARVLPAPTITYHPTSREANIVPRDGAWNLVGKKVLSGATLTSWGVVIFGTERQFSGSQADHFVRELVITCTDTGMHINNKSPRIAYVNPHGDIEASLHQHWKAAGQAANKEPQLLLIVLPNTGVPLYAEIKRVTDTVLGVASQCVQMAHARQAKKQYCANVCLKMNVKLGGTNSAFGANMAPFITQKPTIVFGADVNHPAPGMKIPLLIMCIPCFDTHNETTRASTRDNPNKSSCSRFTTIGDTTRPSIAAVVASVDMKSAKYATSIRTQDARLETIQDLESMVVELLRTFFALYVSMWSVDCINPVRLNGLKCVLCI